MFTAEASMTIEPEMSPSTLSRAVAPSSTYESNTSIVCGFAPRRVMTGGVESGGVHT